MGDIANLVLEGYLCQYCGGYIDGEEPGYQRYCDLCKNDLKTDWRKEDLKATSNNCTKGSANHS
jgi:hypothetical protein